MSRLTVEAVNVLVTWLAHEGENAERFLDKGASYADQLNILLPTLARYYIAKEVSHEYPEVAVSCCNRTKINPILLGTACLTQRNRIVF